MSQLIRFTCSSCGKALEVKAEAIAKKARCFFCRNTMQIPGGTNGNHTTLNGSNGSPVDPTDTVQAEAAPEDPVRITKSAEELLREEIRAAKDLALRLVQWGMGLLASMETAMWFVRNEQRQAMIAAKKLAADEPLPLIIYGSDSVLLVIVALTFVYFYRGIAKRIKKYGEELKRTNQSGIQDLEVPKPSRLLVALMLMAIPIYDVGKRIVIEVSLYYGWL